MCCKRFWKKLFRDVNFCSFCTWDSKGNREHEFKQRLFFRDDHDFGRKIEKSLTHRQTHKSLFFPKPYKTITKEI